MGRQRAKQTPFTIDTQIALHLLPRPNLIQLYHTRITAFRYFPILHDLLGGHPCLRGGSETELISKTAAQSTSGIHFPRGPCMAVWREFGGPRQYLGLCVEHIRLGRQLALARADMVECAARNGAAHEGTHILDMRSGGKDMLGR